MDEEAGFSFTEWLADNYGSTDMKAGSTGMKVGSPAYDAWCQWLEITAGRLPDPVDRDTVLIQVRRRTTRLAASTLVNRGIPQEEVVSAFMLIYSA